MESKTIEDLKLVATFCGYTYYPHNEEGVTDPGWKTTKDTPAMSKFRKKGQDYLCRNHNQLQYNTNWSWLMKVVERIEKVYDPFHGYMGVYIHSNCCTIQGSKLATTPEDFHPAYFAEHYHYTKIEAVFSAVVEFIKWYNQQEVSKQ